VIAALEVELVGEGSDIWPLLGTLATFLAVFVALFGPAVWEWIRRPSLSLSEASDLVSMLGSGKDPRSVPAFVLNAANHGRRQANDVQVFVSVDAPAEVPGESDLRRVIAFQAPIPFFHQEGGEWTRQFSVAIPPGFSRPIRIATIADEGVVLSHGAEPPSNPLDDDVYTVILDVVGSNFRVARFRCLLTIERSVTGYKGRQVKLTQGPKKIRYRPVSPFG
jgi:hypothetical protein